MSYNPQARIELMARIGSRNTRPEIAARCALHAMGYRFRLHRKDLPGRPDLVLPRYGTAIFVHGCFWHQHVRGDPHQNRSHVAPTGSPSSEAMLPVMLAWRPNTSMQPGG